MKINEKLGVPNFIYDVSVYLYNNLIENLKNGRIEKNISDKNLSLETNIKVNSKNETPYKNIALTLEIATYQKVNKYDEMDVMIMNGGAYVKSHNIEDIELILRFALDENKIDLLSNLEWLYMMILKCIIDNKVEIIKIFSHELKHSYDFHKNRNLDTHIDNDFNYVISNMFLKEENIQNFTYSFYYSLCFENLTRPSEMYGELRADNVTKKDFVKKFKQSNMYKYLKWMENFDKDKFLSSIDMNDTEIALILEHYDLEKTPENFMEIYVEVILNSIVEGNLKNELGDNIEILRLLNPNNIEKRVERIKSKFKMLKNMDVFLDFIEKRFNFVGKETIKKVSKIYDLFDNDEKQNNIMDKINKKSEKKNENQLINKDMLNHVIKFDINNWVYPKYKKGIIN